ncbi:MAG: Fe-S protein assembly co-chaperone HscB [Ferruginibacter sp.]|nr:Fe-S protein assembly co-chaperone HscB [Ferruginibacter sp.]
MNYFELFGLEFSPRVDKKDLSKKYFELQKRNHPDYFSQATEVEKKQALEQSALINKAFKTLKDEQLTIAYFLKEKGLLSEDEKYKLPDDFLMEMMDWNEELMEMSKDDVGQKISVYTDKLYDEIKPIIEGYKESTAESDLLKLKEYYYKKKYLQRILDRMED